MKSRMVIGCCLLSACGCSLMVNPFRDEYAHWPPVTTASVEAVLARDVTPSTVQPGGAEKVRCAADGAVTHGPLFFEDPFEEGGSQDAHFAWTVEDYGWMAYWRARFMVNLIAFPVSAVVNPPWQVMASDGHRSCCGRSKEFDAQPHCHR